MKNKNILLLFLISTLAQFPLSTIRFIVPIYAEKLGASTFLLGLIGSAYGLVYIFAAMAFGRLSEKYGYKNMMFTGLIIYAVVILSYILVKNPFMFIFIRGGEAIGMAMVWPSVEAFSRQTKEKNLQHSIMVYTLSWSVAASFAPYVGAILFENITNAIIIISAISIFGALTSLLINSSDQINNIINERKVNSLMEIILPIFVYGFNISIIMSFYPAYGKFINLGIINTGIIQSVSNGFMVFSFLLSGLFLYKIKSKFLIIFGLILQLPVVAIAYNFNFYIQLISSSLILFGLGIIYFTVILNIINSFSKNVGSKTGLFESSISLGYVLGPLLGGIPTILNFKFPWLIMFILNLIIFIFYIIYIKIYKF